MGSYIPFKGCKSTRTLSQVDTENLLFIFLEGLNKKQMARTK